MASFKYLTIEQIVQNEKYPFTIGQLRGHLINRNENGLFVAVRKIGKRVYVREDLFESWIESQAEKK
jgi:hypothetical protein